MSDATRAPGLTRGLTFNGRRAEVPGQARDADGPR